VTVGFSPLGLAVSIAVLAPNLLMLWFPPVDLVRAPDGAGRSDLSGPPAPLIGLERAGQALCLTVPAITVPGPIIWWILIPTVWALAVYYALWVRYLRAGCSAMLLYRPLWRVPVPMAILPAAVFLAAAAWLSNPWIAIAALILAAGHIPVSVITARATEDPAEA
jgi:hypothetical protein